MSKTMLVTGAAGFIGSHVCQALLARGDTVIGLDDFNPYYDPARKRNNLAAVQGSVPPGGRLVFVEGDIRDRAALNDLGDAYTFDAIIHLAGMPGVRASIEDPRLYYDVNLGGTLNLLDLARERRLNNFIFASTSSVYGKTTRIPFLESDACDCPLVPYAASKRAAEMLGFTYHHLYGLNFTACRFFTVYGPRNRPDMMAHKVADNICFGREVPLYDGGRLYRDWTHIDDIVQGILAAADRPLGYEILNLGRGEPVLLADFVHLFEELAGRSARLTPAPMPDTDVPYTFADVSKAAKLLGYAPRVSIQQGVNSFWKWYQQAVLDKRD